MKNKLLLIGLTLLTCKLSAYTEAGEQAYRCMWKMYELKQYDTLIISCNRCLQMPIYNTEDHVHFYVMLMNAYSSLKNWQEHDKAKKALENLTAKDEAAFWEFRSYYDC